jgi:archaellum component FlaF (FlaF/FlaG flagellin family)
MGLSTAAVFVLLFAAGVTSVIYILGGMEDYSVLYIYEEERATQVSFQETQSDIEITSVASSGNELVIVVNNTGSLALDPGMVYLAINDAWIPEGAYSVALLQPPANGYWEPTEAVEITYTAYDGGNATVKVVAETGIEDRYEYAP